MDVSKEPVSQGFYGVQLECVFYVRHGKHQLLPLQYLIVLGLSSTSLVIAEQILIFIGNLAENNHFLHRSYCIYSHGLLFSRLTFCGHWGW